MRPKTVLIVDLLKYVRSTAVSLFILTILSAGHYSTLIAAETFSNSLEMRFVRIPAGSNTLGSSDNDTLADADERPAHRVTFDQPWWLGAHEVTQSQFESVMGERPAWFCKQGGGAAAVEGLNTLELPIDMVSWHDAVEFCRRLSDWPTERSAQRRYRLPTEAEWEYACRAGSTTRYSRGDTLTPRDANIGATLGRTSIVGSYQPNRWGLFDMHGNVWEWCADAYRFDAYTRPNSTDDDEPTQGHVVRGGDWKHATHMARSANRDVTRSTRRDPGNGLRVVVELPATGSR